MRAVEAWEESSRGVTDWRVGVFAALGIACLQSTWQEAGAAVGIGAPLIVWFLRFGRFFLTW